MEIGLSLGVNQGDRLAALRQARQHLDALSATRVLDVSPIYETDPVDVAPEFSALSFYNTVAILESGLEISELARRLHAIERTMGRTGAGPRNAPRPIDIDLIYAGALVLQTLELTLPHPRWAQRRFVVQPLADVRPDLIIPGHRDTVSAIAKRLTDPAGVRRISDRW